MQKTWTPMRLHSLILHIKLHLFCNAQHSEENSMHFWGFAEPWQPCNWKEQCLYSTECSFSKQVTKLGTCSRLLQLSNNILSASLGYNTMLLLLFSFSHTNIIQPSTCERRSRLRSNTAGQVRIAHTSLTVRMRVKGFTLLMQVQINMYACMRVCVHACTCVCGKLVWQVIYSPQPIFTINNILCNQWGCECSCTHTNADSGNKHGRK